MTIEKLREHAEWSRFLEARCRHLVPPMLDASYRRIVGIMVDIESHERRHMRPVFGTFVPRVYETPDGTLGLLTDEEALTVRASIASAMDERYGPKSKLPEPTAQERARGEVRVLTEQLLHAGFTGIEDEGDEG